MIEASALQVLLSKHQVIPIKFAGQRMLLDASGVLIWPKYELMIFSDLHLEKGSFLSQFANPLPRFDSKDTLKRMQSVLKLYRCKSVICLGDSLHDGNALSRMEEGDLATLCEMVSCCEQWIWILGNHDPDIPPSIPGSRAKHYCIDGVLLTHEPEKLQKLSSIRAQIVGHFHPKTAYKLANRKVSGKVFACTDNILLMPAFGKYTGGLDISNPVFTPLIQKDRAQIFMLYHHKIYML